MIRKSGGGRRIDGKHKQMVRFIKGIFVMLGFLLSFPALSFAATPLHDKPPGTIITFSGKQWMILDQMPDGTTYIILNSNDGNRAFDPDNTQLFNPSDSNNIGYYLNNTFYNSLSQKDLIVDHSWDIKFENGTGTQPNVTCKIALISYAEYKTYRSLFPPSGTGYWWWTRTPYSANSHIVWDVNSDGNLYHYYAYNTGGGVRPALYLKSGLMVSDTNEVLGEQATQPAAPAGLSGQAIGPTEVQLNWQPNTESDLAGYIIYRNNTEIARVDNNATSYTDSGLVPGTTYTYGIKAYNTSGLTSDMSNTVTVTTPKPPAPTNLTVSNITTTGATVTWDPVSGAESYNVYLNDFLYAAYVTGTSYNITGLDPATSYTVRVTAVISNVEGESATTSFTTYDQSAPVPPAPPSGFTAQATDPTQVRINWNPNTEPDLAGYIIYRNNTEIARVDSSTTTYTDSGLTPNTSYTYGIKAYNTSNLTSDMRTVQVTTPKPPAPTNLTVSNVTTTGATVTWDPVPGAESYNVYINDFLYDAYLIQTQCDITGLDPATSYTVRVTAVISNVEGDPAATTFTTLVGYKPKLTVRVDNRQIIMSWESLASSFIVEANGQQITTTSDKQYTYTAEPGTYDLRVIAVVDGQQYPSDPVTVTVSAFNTPGVVEAAKDILGNTAAVIFPFGGLIALGLALKASPFLIAAIKNGILIRWFRGW